MYYYKMKNGPIQFFKAGNKKQALRAMSQMLGYKLNWKDVFRVNCNFTDYAIASFSWLR